MSQGPLLLGVDDYDAIVVLKSGRAPQLWRKPDSDLTNAAIFADLYKVCAELP